MAKLQLLLDWSEVWAPFIPLAVLAIRRKQAPFLKPVILYLWLALFINLTGNIIADFKTYLPGWLQSNNLLYNLHSIIRFACFSYFFLLLPQTSFSRLKKNLPLVLVLFIGINFTLFENFLNPAHLSGNLLVAEAYLLLIYCLLYYLAQLREEVAELTSSQDFWVVTGLSIYVVINFYVFLFYVPIIRENPALANQMWNVHNIAYTILCIFLAKAFYEPVGNKFRI